MLLAWRKQALHCPHMSSQLTDFAALGLSPALVQAAAGLALMQPTPIQQAAVPLVLQGRDVQGQAQTGSGKTAAYVLPLLQRLQDAPASTPRRTRVLILVPTRELAAQVGELLRSLCTHLPHRLKTAVVFGGVSINPQMMHLRGGADVVVATPGRLLDLVASNALKLGRIDTLVLDEADRLLELGFADELQQVLALLPAQRQNLFFSATFPPAVQALVSTMLHEPAQVIINAAAGVQSSTLQRAIAVDEAKRTQLLRHLVQENQWRSVLVFVATQYATEHVAEKLYRAGVFATAFHGKLSQGARSQVLAELKAGRWDVVLTTDLAARGIDVAQLPVVINYDLPRSATDYIHRIGRTGRAGASGLAISFVSSATEPHFRLIEKRQGLSVPREHIAGFEPTEPPLSPEAGAGGVKGKRPSKKDKLRAAAAQKNS
jgi:ATP-dependent RNA helicase RhlE